MKDPQVDEKQSGTQEDKALEIVRILAKGIGPLLFLVLLISAISQGGMDRLIHLNGQETISFVCIATMFFGIIWALHNEIAGGILIVVTYVVLALNMGSIFPGKVLPIFLFVGILHLYAGFRAYWNKQNKK